MQHVVEESLDATVGHVASAFGVADQGRQTRSHQARFGHFARQGCDDHFARSAIAVATSQIFGDLERLFHRLNLLHATEFVQRFPVWPQPRKLVDLGMINLFGRERWSHMTRMMGLAATAATFPCLCRRAMGAEGA